MTYPCGLVRNQIIPKTGLKWLHDLLMRRKFEYNVNTFPIKSIKFNLN